MAIVYTHTRLDNGDVFYVGIGKDESRAKDARNRNRHWKHIVKNCDYTIDITHKDIILEEACAIEKYLIAFYGRRDLGTGTLVNLTDGGEGSVNPSPETTKKRMDTLKRTGEYEAMCNRMKEYAKRIDISGINSRVRRECYAYDSNGKFVGHFITLSQCANSIDSSVSRISVRIDTGLPVKKYYLFSKYMGDQLIEDQYKKTDLSKRASNNTKKNPVSILDNNNGKSMNFVSIKQAADYMGTTRFTLYNRLKRGNFDFENYKITLL